MSECAATPLPKRRQVPRLSPELKAMGIVPLNRFPKVGDVYFAKADGSPLVKIGFTSHLHARIRHLECASGRKLTVIHSMPGTHEEEVRLHRRFKGARHDGERFAPVPELLNYIDSLQHAEAT